MEQIQFLILVLPAMTCLNWVIFHSVYASRMDTFRIVVTLLGACCLFLLVDSIYDAPGVSFHTIAWTNLVGQLTAPSIIPLTWLYLERLRRGKDFHSPIYSAWFFIPVSLFTGGVLLYALSDTDEIASILQYTHDNGWINISPYRGSIASFYYIWTFITYRIVMAAEAVLLLIYVIVIYRKEKMSLKRFYAFQFKHGSVSVLELQLLNVVANLALCPMKLVPMKGFMDAHPTLVILEDVVLTVVLAGFGMTALLGVRKEITVKDLVNCLRYNYGKDSKETYLRYSADILLDEADPETLRYLHERIVAARAQEKPAEAPETAPTISERLFSEVASTWEHDSLQSDFDRIMTEEQLFLQPKLRLEDIAEKLHSNKTYVSRMVNNTYGMGFSELINIMRIDYAEQYIIAHRTAKQAEIAEACGFISASAFNNIFKKVTGLTPKSWLSQWGSANETL